MLFQTEKVLLKPETERQEYAWPENYFAEMNPEKRKELLDGRDEEEYVDQLRRLFELRYKKDKTGKYTDTFLRCFLELKLTAEKLNTMFSKKKNEKTVRKILCDLCLDETSEFSQEVIYQEMCQLTTRYIEVCAEDKSYTSALLGFGKSSENQIVNKINLDLEQISENIPKCLNMEEEFCVLKTAILDIKKKYLHI